MSVINPINIGKKMMIQKKIVSRKKTEGCDPRKYRVYIRHYLEEALRKDTNSAGYRAALQKAAWWNKKYRESFRRSLKRSVSRML